MLDRSPADEAAALSYQRINFIDPYARAKYPLIGFKSHGIVALRQWSRLPRLRKQQIGKTAAGLPAIRKHLLNEMPAFCIDRVNAGFSLGLLAAKQRNIHALIGVDPKIAFPIVIAHFPHLGRRFRTGLFLGQQARLLLLVSLMDDTYRQLGL